MEPVFTVHSKVNKQLLLESVWRRTRLFVLFTEIFLFTALGYFVFCCVRDYRYGLDISSIYYVFAFAMLLYLIFWTVYRNYAMVNRKIKHYEATFGQSFIEQEYRFFEDRFEEHNLSAGGMTTLKYEHLYLVLRCKSQLLLRYSQAALHLPYEKISGGTAEELEAFLKRKISKK